MHSFGFDAKVLKATRDEVEYVTPDMLRKICSLRDWQGWASVGTVLHAAPEE